MPDVWSYQPLQDTVHGGQQKEKGRVCLFAEDGKSGRYAEQTTRITSAETGRLSLDQYGCTDGGADEQC